MSSPVVVAQLEEEHTSELGFVFQVSHSTVQRSVPAEIHRNLDEEEVRWYLERYAAEDPFDKSRAELSARYLDLYGRHLSRTVLDELPYDAELGRAIRINVRSVANNCAFHDIHWETLEEQGPNANEITVCREISVPTSRLLKPSVIPLRGESFKIALFVSRPDSMDEDAPLDAEHRLVSKPLSEEFSEGEISLDIIRPGTYDALEKYLESMRTHGKTVHVAHFDVHGVIKKARGKRIAKLRFMDSQFGNDLVTAERLARTLLDYGVRVVVLSACDSARCNAGEYANFAKTLVQCGIDFVFAMSYKLMVSAVTRLTLAFYKSLFSRGEDCCIAAMAARRQLRSDTLRSGRFDVDVHVNDWIVPVSYCAQGMSISFERGISNIPSSSLLEQSGAASSTTAPNSNRSRVIGREHLILQIESRMLLQQKILLLEGPSCWGKTSLVNYLRDWWRRTGLITGSRYIDLESVLPSRPDEACRTLIHAFENSDFASGSDFQSHLAAEGADTDLRIEMNAKSWPLLLRRLQDVLAAHSQSASPVELLVLDGFDASSMLWDRFSAAGKRNPKNPYRTHWEGIFSALRNWSGHVLVTSQRIRDYDDRIESEMLERVKLPELSEHAAYRLLSVSMASYDSRAAAIHRSSRDIKAVTELLEKADFLPGCIILLAPVLCEFDARSVIKSYREGGPMVAWSKEAESRLQECKLYRLCQGLYDKATELERELLHGLSLFSKVLPRDMDGFIAHLTKHQCWASYVPHHLRNVPCDCCRRQQWNTQLIKYILDNSDAGLAGVMKDWWPTPALGKILLTRLHDQGLLYVQGIWVKWNGLGVTPSLRVSYGFHPILTMFLRNKFNDLESSVTTAYEAAFIDYHNWRCLPFQLQRSRSLDPKTLGDKIKQHLYEEIEYSQENFLAAVDIAARCADLDLFQDEMLCSFPFSIFRSMTCDGRAFAMGHLPIEADKVADLGAKTLNVFVTDNDGRIYGIREDRVHAYGAVLGHQVHENGNAQRSYTLLNLLQISNWLCGYYAAKTNRLNLSTQASISRILCACITKDYPEWAETVEAAMLYVRSSESLISGSMSQIYNLAGHEVILSSVRHKVGRILAQIDDAFQNVCLKRTMIGVSEQDGKRLVEDYNKICVAKICEIAPMWDDYLRAIKDDPEMTALLRVQGVQLENPQTEDGMHVEMMDMIDQATHATPGIEGLKLANRAFLETVEKAKNGASYEELLETYTKYNRVVAEELNSRKAHLHSLDLFTQSGDLPRVKYVHLQLIQSYLNNEDWAGLRTHLDSLWVRERRLSLEELSEDEVQVVCIWWRLRGLCAAMLGHDCAWSELYQALEIAETRSPFLDDQQFFALMTLAELEPKSCLDVPPAWSRIIRAGLLAYGVHNQHLYARSGMLLRALAYELTAYDKLNTSEHNPVETSEPGEVSADPALSCQEQHSARSDQLSPKQLEHPVTRADQEPSNQDEDRTQIRNVADNAKFLQTERDMGFFIVGTLLRDEIPPIAWYSLTHDERSALVGAQALVLQQGRTFLVGLLQQATLTQQSNRVANEIVADLEPFWSQHERKLFEYQNITTIDSQVQGGPSISET